MFEEEKLTLSDINIHGKPSSILDKPSGFPIYDSID